MSSRSRFGMVASLGVTWLLSVTGVARAQAPATPAPPPVAPASPDGPAPAPAPTPAPVPLAQPPVQAPAYAPPPGYKLVPINEAPAQSQYPAQYPQPPGALPPGWALPYTDGQAIPPGYHLVERNRRGLIIAGSIMTGVPWVFSVTAAVGADYENKSGFLLIPVLGPWLMLATGGGRDPTCTDLAGGGVSACESNAPLRAVLVLDGLVQTAGGVMFVLGFTNPSKWLVRDAVTMGMAPMTLGRDGHGLGVVGTF
jgi:hypothetical protein